MFLIACQCAANTLPIIGHTVFWTINFIIVGPGMPYDVTELEGFSIFQNAPIKSTSEMVWATVQSPHVIFTECQHWKLLVMVDCSSASFLYFHVHRLGPTNRFLQYSRYPIVHPLVVHDNKNLQITELLPNINDGFTIEVLGNFLEFWNLALFSKRCLTLAYWIAGLCFYHIIRMIDVDVLQSTCLQYRVYIFKHDRTVFACRKICEYLALK